MVAAAMNGSVAVHSGATGAQLATCSPHRKYVIAAAVTAARRIVTGAPLLHNCCLCTLTPLHIQLAAAAVVAHCKQES